MLYPKKNLLKTDSSAWVIGSLNSGDGSDYSVSNAFRYNEYIPVKPNTTYTVSHSGRYKHYIHQYTAGKGHAVSSFWQTLPRTYTTGPNTYFVRIIFRPMDDSLVTMANFPEVLPQFEEGSIATPYEPYTLVNKSAVMYPKKNLINLDASAWENGSISSNGNLFANTFALRSVDVIPIKANVTYVLTVLDAASKIVVSYYDSNKNFVSTPNTFYRDGKTFMAPAGCPYMKLVLMNDDSTVPIVPTDAAVKNKIQIEEGSVATPFELYKAVNKTANLMYLAKGITTIPLQVGVKGAGTTFILEDTVKYNNKPMTRVEVSDVSGSQAKYFGTNFEVKAGKTYYIQAVIYDPSNVFRYSKVYHNGEVANEINGTMSARVVNFNGAYKLVSYKFTPNFNGLLSHGYIHYIEPILNAKFWFGETTVQEGTEIPYSLNNQSSVLVPKKNLLDFSKYTIVGVGATELEKTDEFVRVKTSANATGFVFPVGNLKPNTSYTVNALIEILQVVDDLAEFRVFNRTKGTYVNAGFGVRANASNPKVTIGGTFSTGAISPTDNIEVWITQTWQNGVADQFEFKVYKNTVQLEEGSAATTPEPYRLGNKPAVLYPQKNLLKGFKDFIVNIIDVSNVRDWSMTVGSKLGNGYWLADVKPNTNYTFSIEKETGVRIAVYNKDASINISPYVEEKYITFNTGNNTQVRLYLARAAGNTSDVSNVQFEEGSKTPFEPYRLGNKL